MLAACDGFTLQARANAEEHVRKFYEKSECCRRDCVAMERYIRAGTVPGSAAQVSLPLSGIEGLEESDFGGVAFIADSGCSNCC